MLTTPQHSDGQTLADDQPRAWCFIVFTQNQRIQFLSLLKINIPTLPKKTEIWRNSLGKVYPPIPASDWWLKLHDGWRLHGCRSSLLSTLFLTVSRLFVAQWHCSHLATDCKLKAANTAGWLNRSKQTKCEHNLNNMTYGALFIFDHTQELNFLKDIVM